jgi:hypothetical protein
MSSRKTRVAGLFFLVLVSSSTARAQIPALPGAAAGGASSAAASGLAAAGTGAAAPAAASPTTLWSFLGLSGSNLQSCRAKICASPVGQMLNSTATGPLAAMTGGFIPALCPPAPSASQIAALQAQSPDSAAATAAKIQASEAGAKARVEAVEYLGTVDCTRWKEATTALVNSLRADTNECVRYAAARVLNSGCCCNKQTIEALKICVAGEDTDGKPPETSPRVKAAAFNALQNCLMRVPEVLPEEPKRTPIDRERGPNLEPIPQPLGRERSSMNDQAGSHIAASHVVPKPAAARFEEELQRKTYSQAVNEARHTLFEVARTSNPSPMLPPGKKSVIDLLNKARQDMNKKARASAPPPPGPVPGDPGVVPTSYTSASDLNPGGATTPSVGGSARGPSGPNTSGGVSSTDSSGSSRGLLGLLFNSRNRRTEQ